jgi:hypothetical protein
VRLLLVGATVAAVLQTPPFVARTAQVTRAELGASWHRGCPVPTAGLRKVRLAYWGFDGRRRLGTVVVGAGRVPDVVEVFRRLYRVRFPIRRMRPIDAYGADDERSLAADNTAAFNCRYAIGPGPKRWSAHAYGDAIDVNPVENPYVEGGHVHPRIGRRYLDRSPPRPGMAYAGGALVEAFASAGWQWGGRWTQTPDYQHFSATGG